MSLWAVLVLGLVLGLELHIAYWVEVKREQKYVASWVLPRAKDGSMSSMRWRGAVGDGSVLVEEVVHRGCLSVCL